MPLDMGMGMGMPPMYLGYPMGSQNPYAAWFPVIINGQQTLVRLLPLLSLLSLLSDLSWLTHSSLLARPLQVTAEQLAKMYGFDVVGPMGTQLLMFGGDEQGGDDARDAEDKFTDLPPDEPLAHDLSDAPEPQAEPPVSQ